MILAAAAFAVPSPKERLAERVARRANGLTRQTLPKQVVDLTENKLVADVNGLDNVTHSTVSYSTNWAGAVMSEKTVRRGLSPDGLQFTDLLLHFPH